jgi:hypothetical protein
MTDVQVAVLVGAAGVLVVIFTALTWWTHTQVRRLAAEVATLRALQGSRPPREQRSRRVRPPEGAAWSPEGMAQPPVAEKGSDGDDSSTKPVPVITGLAEDQPTDGVEPSTARIASVTLGPPLLKVAAFTYGVRRALREEQRMRVSYAVRKELRRQTKLRRRSRRRTVVPHGSDL